jgi:SAM-dependent methyltransferase
VIRSELHERNRHSWNAATVAHNSHKPDQAGFLRGGGSTLFEEEIALLGDIRGQEVLHLLCNSGQDTLGIAALGASVTGVDISDEAIAFARRLSEESGIPGTFERSDVYPWLDAAIARGRSFDTIFASYGALCWLSDLDEWMKRVAAVLKPGGRFVCIEFHPVAMIFDEQGAHVFDYSNPGEPLHWEDGVSDYVGASDGGLIPSGTKGDADVFVNPHPCAEFQRGVGDILGAVLAAGLQLAEFREYPYSNGWKPYSVMRSLPGRRWSVPTGKPSIPLMYGLVAGKK